MWAWLAEHPSLTDTASAPPTAKGSKKRKSTAASSSEADASAVIALYEQGLVALADDKPQQQALLKLYLEYLVSHRTGPLEVQTLRAAVFVFLP
jgi:hypothetical protein